MDAGAEAGITMKEARDKPPKPLSVFTCRAVALAEADLWFQNFCSCLTGLRNNMPLDRRSLTQCLD